MGAEAHVGHRTSDGFRRRRIRSDDDGQTYVSAKAPSECVGTVNVRHLEMTGTRLPGALLAPLQIEDADAWVSEYKAKGFSFEEQ